MCLRLCLWLWLRLWLWLWLVVYMLVGTHVHVEGPRPPPLSSQFVRFAWARSRLPPRGATWTSKFGLSVASAAEDRLPIAHTCFFSVELPPYSNDERMRRALLTAIHFGCGGILNS